MKKQVKIGILFFMVFSSFCWNTQAQKGIDKNRHVYLLIGQSNMAGRGLVDAESKLIDPQIIMLDSQNHWVPATDPVHFDKPKDAGVGPAISFGKTIKGKNKKIKIALVPCAWGGSPIKVWEPGASYLNAHPYDDAVKRAKIAMKTGVLKGIIWHQGESDNDSINSTVYLEKLVAVVNRIRGDLQMPNLPFVAGEIGYFNKKNFINKEVNRLPQKVGNTLVVSANGLEHKGDGLHFNTASARELGRHYAEAMLQLQQAEPLTISEHQSGSSFQLFNKTSVASIVIDEKDAKVVSLTAEAFTRDVALVSGKSMQVENRTSSSSMQIIAGTFGNSETVDALVKQQGINISAIKGQWESFLIKVISPTKLLVVGSDPRGTAYGILHLSKLMGVSPWVWWADAVPAKKTQLYISGSYMSKSPSVKFRGIFLNDEDWGLQPWAAKTFEPETGDIGPKTYGKIFELLLRLRANLIWPAMHPSTKAFFHFPGNIQMAEDYAIVVGSSHAEPMLRNNVDEWKEKTMGQFNYLTNHDSMYHYWEERVIQSKGLNAVYTIGLRGVHDGVMKGAKTLEEQTKLMGVAVKEQREMLMKHINPDIEKVPQAFIPYKEVQDIYDYGFEVPKDATLVWCDDNYGYIKHFPNEKERQQKGGNGVYYHLSYWGRPHDYLWLSSTHPAQVYTQMRMAYDKGAKDMWVANVGDIKPCEYLSELFFDMAWNMDSIGNNKKGLEQHLQSWLAREFDPTKAKTIASVMGEYYRLAYIRKPEFMGGTRTEESDPKYKMVTDLPWSEDEINQRLKEYDIIDKKVLQLTKRIPTEKQDAWFQLVEYPVRGAAAMNRKLLYAQLARHGKAEWKLSDAAYDTIVALTNKYNALGNGKWKYMMDFKPRKLQEYDKVIQTTADKPLIQPEQPLLVFNGTDYSSFAGQKPIAYGLGYLGGAVSVAKGSSIEFQATINKSDSISIHLMLAPNHPTEGTKIRYSIQVNDEPAQIIDYATQGRSEEWKQNVLTNQAIRITKHHIGKQGKQTVKITALDDGVIIDQVKIYSE